MGPVVASFSSLSAVFFNCWWRFPFSPGCLCWLCIFEFGLVDPVLFLSQFLLFDRPRSPSGLLWPSPTGLVQSSLLWLPWQLLQGFRLTVLQLVQNLLQWFQTLSTELIIFNFVDSHAHIPFTPELVAVGCRSIRHIMPVFKWTRKMRLLWIPSSSPSLYSA